jgi:hypothetical protein
MLVLSSLIGILFLAISLPQVEAVVSRQSSPPRAASVYSGGGWIEHIAVRSNGQILLPKTDVPELWGLDPTTKTASKLLSFPNCLGLTGVAEVSPDLFVVLAGNFSTRSTSIKTGSWVVWTVDFRNAGSPKSTRIKAVPESGFFLGTSAINNNTILIADAHNGCMYKMDLDTGNYNVVLADKSMDRNGQLAGIHGLHYLDGYAYYSNTFGGGLWKLKVDSTGKASGSPSQIATFDHSEDFVIASDGTYYINKMTGGNFKISADGKTTSELVSVGSPTGVALGRGEKDKNVLYFATAGGAVLSATMK